jgi:hypothetical protein
MNMHASQRILDGKRFARLRETSTFRDGRLGKWQEATIGIVGAGMLGLRFATEAVLSGTAVQLYDFGVGRCENQATQFVREGVPKVESAVAACDAICPGCAVGHPYDVRHAGVGELAKLNMLVDSSDDPALAIPLTRLSNGLGIPLLRLAVDGSGELEMGRVLCSHGGAGHACQMCTYAFQDLLRPTRRTPCPGQPTDKRPPTIAGGGLGAAIAGCGLLQAQRMVTGNDLGLVLDREILVDMTQWNLLAIERRRSNTCLSGHVRFEFIQIGLTADVLTPAHLFAEAQQRLGTSRLTIEPYGHALCVEATCNCGAWLEAVGTQWAPPPRCRACGGTMSWLGQTQHSHLTMANVEMMEIGDTPLSELGLPRAGAMFVARTAGKPPLRMLLK